MYGFARTICFEKSVTTSTMTYLNVCVVLNKIYREY